ncbi:MAG: hypothetical protein E7474_12345 [Ruminococcaceae bacterium]|nr:hypothetical protein [Oscillospiraceae bacterium]
MSDFKINGLPPQPVTGGAGSGKVKAAETAKEAGSVKVPGRSGFDTASVNPNRLAVMPRMSTAAAESVQRMRGETVESLLRDSAAELDGYFTKAYGFEE